MSADREFAAQISSAKTHGEVTPALTSAPTV